MISRESDISLKIVRFFFKRLGFLFKDLSLNIIMAKTILSSGSTLAFSHFLPEYFFYLSFFLIFPLYFKGSVNIAPFFLK
jgi:hypothetical protein